MYTSVNLLPVVASAIASMGVGFFWYSEAFLGKPWSRMMGLTSDKLKKAQKGMGSMYALSMVAAFITAWVLSKAMVWTGFLAMDKAFFLAFKLWLGFIAPVQMTEVIFGGKKWGLFAINTSYQLASILVMAAILSVWR